MLEKINLKQKIIIITSISVIVVAIGIISFYTFIKNQETEVDLEQLVDITQGENSIKQNEANEENSNQIKEEQKEIIIVHITGEVKNTGIIILEKGARIVDAIKKAGGETKEADLNEVNLAYELQDGQQIYIPNKKDKTKNEGKMYITSESGNNVIKQESSNSNKGVNKKVNINIANQSELETLPGIGESIASRIIEYREQNGKFQKIEDLQNVKGIGDSKFAKIKDLVTV